MMLSLGMFVFSLSTLAYQELQRQTNWRHASNSRVGAPPALQFVGRGDDTIALPGIILPELAGSVLSLDALRLMANTGKAWPMVEGRPDLRVVGDREPERDQNCVLQRRHAPAHRVHPYAQTYR